MRLRAIPSFERAPLAAIITRNPNRADEMAKAMVAIAELPTWASADRTTRIELMREALRPFDKYAARRGRYVQ
jgi:hypothetical protein